jgi:hypothetical protein
MPVAGLLGELEPHRLRRLLLHHGGAGRCLSSVRDILHAELDQIATAQLAVDGEIEQCEVSGTIGTLQSDPESSQSTSALRKSPVWRRGIHARRYAAYSNAMQSIVLPVCRVNLFR